MFVQVTTPIISGYVRELAFEKEETRDKIDRKIRDEAQNLCLEIQKELAIEVICSHEFRNL